MTVVMDMTLAFGDTFDIDAGITRQHMPPMLLLGIVTTNLPEAFVVSMTGTSGGTGGIGGNGGVGGAGGQGANAASANGRAGGNGINLGTGGNGGIGGQGRPGFFASPANGGAGGNGINGGQGSTCAPLSTQYHRVTSLTANLVKTVLAPVT